MNILSYIQTCKNRRHKLLAILLDPEKTELSDLHARTAAADIVLVGGSTGTEAEKLVLSLKSQIGKPVVLFPGNMQQFTPQADALLFLSVLSSRNPEMLIGRQIEAARQIKQSGIETIPMGYILIDGGRRTAVETVSHSAPIPQDDIELITDTAVAAELLGMRTVYLEAGSGAATPVSAHIIQSVRQAVTLPLIVGGGICTTRQMIRAFNAGADIVVIGNRFEQHPEDIPLFAAAMAEINKNTGYDR